MKKAVSIITTFAIILSLTIGCVADDSTFVTPNAASATTTTLEKDTFNEYDHIVAVRNYVATENEDGLRSTISNEELDFIMSDEIESELLYRSKLSTQVLKEQYCYSDEAINILRNYNGGRLEENPELRAVTATLSASLGPLIQGDTKMGIIYTWEWDYRPFMRFSDIAAMSWEGTYEGGLTNNMALDRQTSFATVNYYYSQTNQKQDRYTGADFLSDNDYNGAAIKFPMEKYDNAWYYWAKYGSLFIYMDLVNQDDGPLLYELSTHGEYAHYTFSSIGAGVSFPLGTSISFSGVYETLGVRNYRVRPM